MGRFKLFIEYEGTRYRGWQMQKNARTIQGELMRVMRAVFGTDEYELYGSGRTDAGVHALEQVAHLDVKTMLAPEIIRMKVNDELPPDINLIAVEKAPRNFHARHDAVARSYLYQIARRRTALGKRFVWWIKDELDVNAMRNAARSFVGLHDLRSFTSDDPDEKSTKAEVIAIEIEETGHLLLIRIRGSHFLWKMVRRMVGTLAEVGRGSIPPGSVRRLLLEESNGPAAVTAPPSGLFLEKVFYSDRDVVKQIRPVILVP